MRTSNPNHLIPNVWDQNGDTFDHNQLVANWDAIDNQLGQPRTSNSITQASSLTIGLNNTTDRGKILYLTAPDGGYPTGTIVRWNGTTWNDIKGVELLTGVPASNNYDGRMVLLTASSGGFSAWTLVRYQGGTWFVVNQGIEQSATVPSSGNFAGRVVILTAATGGYNAFDVIRYDGASWAKVGPQAIPPGTELAYFAHTTSLSTSNAAAPGDTLVTFSAGTFENVKYYFEFSIPWITHSVGSAITSIGLYEVSAVQGQTLDIQMPATVGNGGHLTSKVPFTPSAGSHTYNVKWFTSSGTATIPINTAHGQSIFRIIKA